MNVGKIEFDKSGDVWIDEELYTKEQAVDKSKKVRYDKIECENDWIVIIVSSDQVIQIHSTGLVTDGLDNRAKMLMDRVLFTGNQLLSLIKESEGKNK